jgi:hypothetical protein
LQDQNNQTKWTKGVAQEVEYLFAKAKP